MIVTDRNFMFTPDFEYYFSVDVKAEEFIIKKTATGELYHRISRNLFSTALRGQANSKRGVI